MSTSIFVIEGKEKTDVEQNRDFETTLHVFHEFSAADETAHELISEGIFDEIRIREYRANKDDEGYIVFKEEMVK